MKHKTLFRLMLKVLGVWVFVMGTASLLQLLVSVSLMVLTRPPLAFGSAYDGLFGILGPVFQVAAGLYLFFGGRWLADRAIPSNRPYCHECGYELTGATADLCPECGTAFRTPIANTPAATIRE